MNKQFARVCLSILEVHQHVGRNASLVLNVHQTEHVLTENVLTRAREDVVRTRDVKQ